MKYLILIGLMFLFGCDKTIYVGNESQLMHYKNYTIELINVGSEYTGYDRVYIIHNNNEVTTTSIQGNGKTRKAVITYKVVTNYIEE